ncbi:MAG TPA: CDGSH iron-sulfur domain-containing protein [Planctomycetota bacterium]|nr:CDGSH iron-sulfur domain-containing protein [Planctomycetota bacterium]
MDQPTPTIAGRRPIVTTLEPGTYYWCACGKSLKQPFCDGSHAGTAFRPMQFKVEEKKQVALCACKHSRNMPYCDGSHRNLPPA